MDILDKLNGALDYIEDNLAGEIDMQIVAKKACCSVFNFQRMFSFIADVPLAEYIRKRRLSQVAIELQSSDIKIIDLAIKYGYDSQVSFSRAFQKLHGVSPSEARKAGVALKAYPRITFEITIKGVEEMKYRIETKEAFRMVGVKEAMCTDNGENFKRIPKFWDEVYENGTCEKIMSFSTEESPISYGVCANFRENGFDYYITTVSEKNAPKDMEELFIPKNMWVIFECVGKLPDSQQNVWKRIFTEWFPNSGYEHADGPEIEWYSDGDTTSDDYKSEIWIPIVKSNK